MSDEITYEQPLNERMRVLLRLEFLFAQVDHFRGERTSWDTRAAVFGLSEILSIFSRMDVKSELMKELERQAQMLGRIKNNPDVDVEKLEQILGHINRLRETLFSISGQVDQALKQSEFLSSVRQRASIPGGSCSFDLPAYHFWLRKPDTERNERLNKWLQPFEPIRAALELTLRLLRTSSPMSNETAVGGFFQRTLDGGTSIQLLRVQLLESAHYVAEISGGKHRVNIRFLEFDPDNRPTQTENDITFRLAICGI